MTTGKRRGTSRTPEARTRTARPSLRALAGPPAFWRSLFEQFPDIVVVAGRDRRIAYVNHVPAPAAVEAVIGADLLRYVPRDQRRAIRATLARVFRTGTWQRWRMPVRGPGGAVTHYEARAHPISRGGRVAASLIIAVDVTAQVRFEETQAALYRISEAAHTAASLQELFGAIHRIIGELMPARNFYIALQDERTGTISFPYFVDEYDTTPAPKPPGKGFTEYVLRTGEPLLATPEVSRALEQRGEVELIGAPSIDWLGVPLRTESRTIGVLVVQTYTAGVRYSETNRDVLEFVSRQVAMAIARKRAEEAVRESEERYRQVVELAPDIIVVHSGGKILFVNAAGVRRVGAASPDEIVGRDVLDFVHPATRPAVLERLAMLARGEAAPVMAGRLLRLDGSAVDVELLASPIRYHDRPAILSVVHDVTERLEAEQALRRSEAALRRSEEQFRAFVETTADWVWSIDAAGVHTYSNPAVVEILGYAPEEIVGRSAFILMHEGDRPEVERQLRALAAERRGWRNLVIRWRRKDGAVRFLESSAAPILGAGGRLEGWRGVDRDVTARRQLEDQLRQSQKMEAVGLLAGGVAHDFNNLLTTVMASTDLLATLVPPDAPGGEDIDSIQAATRRAADLTGKLLAFSRQQPLEMRNLTLATLLPEFVRMARRVVPEDVEVVLQLDAPDAVVRADPVAIEQILMNLATNARDAMRSGGTLRFRVERAVVGEEERAGNPWFKPGEYVVLAVSDTGAGMDAETQRRVFEPFFTTKPIGQGTGLGMAMVYGLVKQHDGYVTVRSAAGEGTTVRIYLPPASGAAAPLAPAAAAPPAGGTETILLVEDDPAVQRAATRVLERFGYTVLRAADGFEALAAMEALERPPDLIISDVVMPHTSGPKLLSALRDSGKAPRILFTSGYTARAARERTNLEPGVPFLPKPWTMDDLLRKVREVLDAPSPAARAPTPGP
jgi:two-component system cell cycle sensor histidine kinase/response regulator CckA